MAHHIFKKPPVIEKMEPLRQQLYIAYYLDPKSPTFGNSKQSAIRAGFTESYAEMIMSHLPEWLAEKLTNNKYTRMLEKAERNIEEALELPSQTQAMGAFGPLFEKIKVKSKKVKGKRTKTEIIKKPIMRHDVGLLKLKMVASEFVAETVGKAKFSRKEGDGGNTFNVVIFQNEQRSKVAKRIIGGGSVGSADGSGESH